MRPNWGTANAPGALGAWRGRRRRLCPCGVLVATLLSLRWAFGGSGGRLRALALFQDREEYRCARSACLPTASEGWGTVVNAPANYPANRFTSGSRAHSARPTWSGFFG